MSLLLRGFFPVGVGARGVGGAVALITTGALLGIYVDTLGALQGLGGDLSTTAGISVGSMSQSTNRWVASH